MGECFLCKSNVFSRSDALRRNAYVLLLDVGDEFVYVYVEVM